MAPYQLIYVQQKPHTEHLADYMHPFTIDSLETRPLTRPNTAIRAFHTSKKRHLLKPALSSFSNAKGLHWLYDSVAIHLWC